MEGAEHNSRTTLILFLTTCVILFLSLSSGRFVQDLFAMTPEESKQRFEQISEQISADKTETEERIKVLQSEINEKEKRK